MDIQGYLRICGRAGICNWGYMDIQGYLRVYGRAGICNWGYMDLQGYTRMRLYGNARICNWGYLDIQGYLRVYGPTWIWNWGRVDIQGYGTKGIWTCRDIWLRIWLCRNIWWYNGYAGTYRYMWLTIYMDLQECLAEDSETRPLIHSTRNKLLCKFYCNICNNQVARHNIATHSGWIFFFFSFLITCCQMFKPRFTHPCSSLSSYVTDDVFWFYCTRSN